MAMPRGQRPKPTALKIIEGNKGKRPLPKNEPKFTPGEVPPPPDFLEGDALKEWHRMLPILMDVGLMTAADAPAFSAYCQAYGRWAKAERELARSGFVEITSTGTAIQHPLVGTANKAMADVVKFCCEFGMTPSSRTRVAAEKTEPKKNGKKKDGTTNTEYF